MSQRNSKVIFITGAGAGIGAATAKHFVAMGWRVGLYDRDKAAVDALAASLGADVAHAGLLDVTDTQAWQQALAEFMQWSGRLDVLLNNAGILYSGDFSMTSMLDHARTFQVNVIGMMNGCHAALPWLQQTKGSRVINMSSASAIYGQASLASYSSSKFAVRGMTEALDLEWQKYGIRVMDVMPLFVQTSMVTDMDAQSIKKMGVKLTADDVAQVVAHAATVRSIFAPTHWTVGLTTTLLYKTSGLMPDRLLKLINRWVTT